MPRPDLKETDIPVYREIQILNLVSNFKPHYPYTKKVVLTWARMAPGVWQVIHSEEVQ